MTIHIQCLYNCCFECLRGNITLSGLFCIVSMKWVIFLHIYPWRSLPVTGARFYSPDTLLDIQTRMSEHWRQHWYDVNHHSSQQSFYNHFSRQPGTKNDQIS